VNNNIALEFFLKHKAKMECLVESYLLDRITLDNVRDYAWEIVDAWDQIRDVAKSEPYADGEEALWAIVWTSQHLADEEHLPADRVKGEIRELLGILKSQGDLPKGIDARRP
jgi:hypothetical protein